MKEYQSSDLRSLALIGQRGGGKTSLADALAFLTGVNNRQGKVDEGTSISDFTAVEIDRRASFSTTALALPWKDVKVNLIDTPGHPDYSGQVITGLQAVGNACLVIDAQNGPEAGSRAAYEIAQRYHRPIMIFVNKVEKENVKWESVLAAIKEEYGNKVAPVNIPIGSGESFRGIIDLLKMKSITFDSGGKRQESDIPADQKESAEKWRENLIEQVAETDDTLLEKFFEDGSLSDDEIKNGLRKGALNGKVYPTLFGSAENMAGVQLFADFLVSYLPAPLDFEHVRLKKVGTDDTVDIKIDPSAKPVLYFYKTSSEGQSGDTFCFRVMTGSVTPGTELTNHSRGGSERLGQLYVLTGKDRAEVSVLHAGDLGAATKLKDTHTGNSLSTKDNPLVFPEPVYPEPVADAAISPLKKGDEEKMSQGLSRLREADPSFKVVSDPALKQTVLIGQGMTQVENLLERLKKDFGVEVETSKPRIPYRETIRGKTEIQHRYKKQSGGRGQFGDVHLRLEPQTRGEGFEFVNAISGGVIPTKYIPSVEKGVREAMIEGQLSGSPIVDVKATVFYGSYHAVDSSDMAFKIAASMAFKEGIAQCKPILLEPIFEVEVIAPEKNAGDVMGDVSSRRGKILGMEPDGSRQIVSAHIPQAELYNYSVDLRSMTQGQGRYTRKFSHYEAAPGDVQKKIVEEYTTARREA